MMELMRKLITVEDLARLVFEELDLNLWHYMWFEFKGHLNEFIKVLFLVYYFHCRTDMLDWLSASLNESDY
jgi:hypothetical protein